MIVISGAAGKTGRAIMRVLVERGEAVRGFVNRNAYAAEIISLGAEEVVVGDMRDEVAFGTATDGASAVYHICPNVNPDEVAIGKLAIDSALAAGIERFIYHSVLHPHVEAMPHHWLKMRVEEMLFESGLDFTILQPAAYMQNVLGSWNGIVEEGVYRVPYPIETRLGMVDLDDVAEAAATVLTESGHSGAIYELAGPENPTQVEVAAVLSAILGRKVRAEQMPVTEWEAGSRSAGLGAYQIETLVKMFRYYEQHGFGGNSRVLEWLLQRPATSFRRFVERIA